ncbi:MAG TPA: 3-hydroxyacyl-CoA dehydrogenase NAD-binding domain-containing protein [Chitinophagaceae bacterium]|nr:3-hydroxyacyl-CoA dehydrogenase NAD-binding domain-containing protein [Chitinophagaceae bacterium]
MHKITICGAGIMGSGIAQVVAQSGFRTILFDLDQAIIQKAKTSISKNLQSLLDKKKISPEQKELAESIIVFTSDINDCKADLIIEAIVERLDAKLSLFRQLAELNSPETILATNTSSLSVKDIAEKNQNPERVIGLHFFNPAPLMKLLEIVNTPFTSQEITNKVISFARDLGKTPVLCKDSPGFIVNHVARPYYIEALRLVEEGLTDFETIDQLLESAGFKMGPFKLMDLIGNDINYAVSCSVFEALGKPHRLEPSKIQEEKVKAGDLGRKSGKGYYKYEG